MRERAESMQRRLYQCYICKKSYRSDVVEVDIDGASRTVCLRCWFAYCMHLVARDVLQNGGEEDLRHLLRVLEGINDLVEDNPMVQALRHVIDEWANKYPRPLYVDELEAKWRYRLGLDKVLKYLEDEGIFRRAQLAGVNKIILSPGDLLRSLLKRFSTSRGFFRDLVKVVTGLAIVRFLKEGEIPKIRAIYATVRAISECIESGVSAPVFRVKGYKCKCCNAIFATRHEATRHLLERHASEIGCSSDECLSSYIEPVADAQIGMWCRESFFISKAGVYGVRNINKFFRELLTRGAIVPVEGDEVVIEVNGERFIAVDNSWGRFVERMRTLERQLVRVR